MKCEHFETKKYLFIFNMATISIEPIIFKRYFCCSIVFMKIYTIIITIFYTASDTGASALG